MCWPMRPPPHTMAWPLISLICRSIRLPLSTRFSSPSKINDATDDTEYPATTSVATISPMV